MNLFSRAYTGIKKSGSLLLLFILALGFLLRVYRLGGPSFWFDELMTAGRISFPLGQIASGVAILPFPPLYYILMHFWAKLFGISEFSLRFPSLIFSVLSITVIFKLGKELFDRKAGLLAALLLSISLYNIDFAREAKMYAMVWFFGLLSFYFFYKFIKDKKARDLVLYIASTTAALYTLYVGFLFIIVQNAAFFLFFFNRALLKKWLAAQAIVILLYLPWLGFFLPIAAYWIGPRWVPQEVSCIKFVFDFFGFGYPNALYVVYAYAVLFLSAFLLPKTIKERSGIDLMKNEYFLLAWIVIPFALLWLIHIFLFPIARGRYLGFSHFPLIIICSKGLSRYSAKIRYSFLALLLVFTFAYNLYPYYKFHPKLYITFPPEDWRALFRRIDAEKGDNALVAAFSEVFVHDRYLYNKYFYFSKGIRYYNHNREIPVFTREKLDEFIRGRKYDSIFLVYYQYPEIEGGIEGYRLAGKFEEAKMGYLWFKKP